MNSIIWILPIVIIAVVIASKRHPHSIVVSENTPQEEIKKKVKKYFLLTRLLMGLVMLIVVSYLEFFVAPDIRKVYLEFGLSHSPITNFLPYIIVSIIGLAVFTILRTSKNLSYVSSSIEEGKLKITPRFSAKQEVLLLILLGLLVGLLMYSYMSPIYSLTRKF